MITRWAAKRSIDTDTPISTSELQQCINESCEKLHKTAGPAFGIAIMLPAVFVFGVMVMLMFAYDHPLWLFALMSVVIAITFVSSAILVSTPLIRKELRRRIRARGFDVCAKCGYYLQGLDESIERCPECGCERDALSES